MSGKPAIDCKSSNMLAYAGGSAVIRLTSIVLAFICEIAHSVIVWSPAGGLKDRPDSIFFNPFNRLVSQGLAANISLLTLEASSNLLDIVFNRQYSSPRIIGPGSLNHYRRTKLSSSNRYLERIFLSSKTSADGICASGRWVEVWINWEGRDKCLSHCLGSYLLLQLLT